MRIRKHKEPFLNVSIQVLATCEETSTRTKLVEEMTRKSMDLVNVTRRELQDGIKVVKASANRRPVCPSIPDGKTNHSQTKLIHF